MQIHPKTYPAELIEVVESLRDDVDTWKFGAPDPGVSPPKSNVGRPGFVDADTALTYLRWMVEKGLSDRLRDPEEAIKVWDPGDKHRTTSDEG